MDLYERASRAVDHLESLSSSNKVAAILGGALDRCDRELRGGDPRSASGLLRSSGTRPVPSLPRA